MGRENIFKTLNVSSIINQSTLEDLLGFLIANRGAILPPIKRSELFRSRFSGRSPITEIVHRLIAVGKDQNYSLMKLPPKTIALREVVDMSFIPLDVLQIKDAISHIPPGLSVFPDIDDKLIINITDLTRASGEFSDVSAFHNRIVRDFLSRSYYNSTNAIWISPSFVRYIAKVYNMTLGAEIARLFALSPVVRSFIQTVFCLFFVGKMTSSKAAVAFVKSNARELGIYDTSDLIQITALSEEAIGKPVAESIIEVCKVIAAYDNSSLGGIDHPRLDIPVLNKKFSNLHTDNHLSRIALEYPPYFAFIVLFVLSGGRTGLSFQMDRLGLLKEGRTIMDQVVKSPSLLSGF